MLILARRIGEVIVMDGKLIGQLISLVIILIGFLLVHKGIIVICLD